MDNKLKNKSLIKKLFQQFFENKISAEDLIDKWPNKDEKQSSLEGYLLHELGHYITDRDLHEKDPEYKDTLRIDSKFQILLGQKTLGLQRVFYILNSTIIMIFFFTFRE